MAALSKFSVFRSPRQCRCRLRDGLVFMSQPPPSKANLYAAFRWCRNNFDGDEFAWLRYLASEGFGCRPLLGVVAAKD